MPNLLPATLILLMWSMPVSLAMIPWLLAENLAWPWTIGSIACGFVIFVTSFLVTSGLLSWPAQKKIIRGRFPRENFHKHYFWRRIYGCCWTTVFYFKPLYSIYLSIPVLKSLMFRLFGYRGPLKFTIYPDTWVRDLPLLHFGIGSYFSNRATIGSNICFKDGTILVDRIFFGDRALVGHLTMIAPGVKMENDSEVGVGSAIGVRCRLKEGSKVAVACSINHGAIIGSRSEVGSHSFIGLKSEIGPDLTIPAGANIPAGVFIHSQADVNKYISSENQDLRKRVAIVAEQLESNLVELKFDE